MYLSTTWSLEFHTNAYPLPYLVTFWLVVRMNFDVKLSHCFAYFKIYCWSGITIRVRVVYMLLFLVSDSCPSLRVFSPMVMKNIPMLNFNMVNCLPEFCSFFCYLMSDNWISVDLPYMLPACLYVSLVTVVSLTNLQADFLIMAIIYSIYEAYQERVFMWWCISLFLAITDWFLSSSAHLFISSYMVQFLMGLVWIVWFLHIWTLIDLVFLLWKHQSKAMYFYLKIVRIIVNYSSLCCTITS